MTLDTVLDKRMIGPLTEPSPRVDDIMLISEVAAAVGLEPKTIRFYERAKLVTPRRHGRFRIFRSSDLARLQGIKKLRQYGLPLSTIRLILKTEGDLTLETVNSPNVQVLLAGHLEEMNRKHEFFGEQIADLTTRLDFAKSTEASISRSDLTKI